MSNGLDQLAIARPGCAVTIGNFDGVHVGHQALLRAARRLAGPAKAVVAVTFDPHPMMVLRPEMAPPRLLPLDLKVAALKDAGADEVVVLKADAPVLELSADAFLAHLSGLKPAAVVEGSNFVFGRNRTGTPLMLARWCEDIGAVFEQLPDVEVSLCDGSRVPVSSTLGRWLVARGRVRDAARVLGRAHQMAGVVMPGKRRGRTIGFPTANLESGDQVVPSEGVYAGRAKAADGQWYQAAISVGVNPTFGDQPLQVEVHFKDFDGDLYGQRLIVEMFEFLRGQRKFFGVEQLKAQLARDVEQAAGIRHVSLLPLLATC